MADFPIRIVNKARTQVDIILTEELDVLISTTEEYIRVLNRVKIRVELLGRELGFEIKDIPEISDGRIKWASSKLSLQAKRLSLNFYVKYRAGEFTRALDNHLSIIMDNLDQDDLKGCAKMIVQQELPALCKLCKTRYSHFRHFIRRRFASSARASASNINSIIRIRY